MDVNDGANDGTQVNIGVNDAANVINDGVNDAVNDGVNDQDVVQDGVSDAVNEVNNSGNAAEENDGMNVDLDITDNSQVVVKEKNTGLVKEKNTNVVSTGDVNINEEENVNKEKEKTLGEGLQEKRDIEPTRTVSQIMRNMRSKGQLKRFQNDTDAVKQQFSNEKTLEISKTGKDATKKNLDFTPPSFDLFSQSDDMFGLDKVLKLPIAQVTDAEKDDETIQQNDVEKGKKDLEKVQKNAEEPRTETVNTKSLKVTIKVVQG